MPSPTERQEVQLRPPRGHCVASRIFCWSSLSRFEWIWYDYDGIGELYRENEFVVIIRVYDDDEREEDDILGGRRREELTQKKEEEKPSFPMTNHVLQRRGI